MLVVQWMAVRKDKKVYRYYRATVMRHFTHAKRNQTAILRMDWYIANNSRKSIIKDGPIGKKSRDVVLLLTWGALSIHRTTQLIACSSEDVHRYMTIAGHQLLVYSEKTESLSLAHLRIREKFNHQMLLWYLLRLDCTDRASWRVLVLCRNPKSSVTRQRMSQRGVKMQQLLRHIRLWMKERLWSHSLNVVRVARVVTYWDSEPGS